MEAAAVHMPSGGEQAQVLPFERGKRVLTDGEKAILIELVNYGIKRWQNSKQYSASRAETEYDKGVGLGAAMKRVLFVIHGRDQVHLPECLPYLMGMIK